MPFVLRDALTEAEDLAMVLAFGKLSVLEVCSVLGRSVQRAEAPCERVSVFKATPHASMSFRRLAGVHKCAPLTTRAEGEVPDLGGLVDELAQNLGEKQNLSVSGYDLGEGEYEDLVRALLDGVRGRGLRKVRLLRPKNNELMAEDILRRAALDVIAFPYRDGIGLGPTAWVPDSFSMRRRGANRPVPHSDITLSPRLARVLLNLAGLQTGQLVLDPFCGSGAILAEAFMDSLYCIGLDSSAARVHEAVQNLRWLGGIPGSRYDVRKGDARDLNRFLRGRKVDAIVTEPVLLPTFEARPRTATAEDLVDRAGEVYSRALDSMADSIRPGGRIVVVVPVIQTMEGEEVALSLDGRRLGLRFHQPGPVGFEYPVRLSFESTRWVKRAVYVFESPF